MNLGGKMKLLVFDVDGTILNTLDTIIYHVNETLKENGLNEVDDSDYIRKALGYGSLYLIEQALTHPNNNVHDEEKTKYILDYYTKRYNSNASYLTEPYKGVLELLKQLKDEGYILIAYSNKPDIVLQDLMVEKFGENLFDHIEGQKDGIPSKPNPQVLNNIIKEYGISKEDTLYIGDSEVDVKTAKNTELKVVAVTWGFRSREFLEKLDPDYLADNTKELKEIIDSLRK